MTLWVSILSYGAALLGVALVAAYMYIGRRHDHWKKKGVKHLKPLPFVGNMKDVALVRRNIGEIFKDIYDKYKKEPYMGVYSFDEPVLLINDLNLIRSVLVKDFQYFCDRNFSVSEKVDPLGAKNLFSLKGDRWKQSRSAITPSFTSGKMKQMYGIIHEQAILLTETLKKENSGKPITVYELVARYTTDVIASCAFGIESGTLQDPRSEFRRKLKMIFDLSPVDALRILGAFLCPKLLEAGNIRVFKQEVIDYVTSTIKNAILHREQNDIRRNDLLDSLVQIVKEGKVQGSEETSEGTKTKLKMDDVDLVAHSLAFMGAGFETSATTISYALYELSKRQDIQDRLREDIRNVLKEHGGHIPYDVLQSMKYLDLVFQETLRKYPPVPFLDRRSNAAYRLPNTNLTLEADSVIIVPVLAIHRDPEIYPNPMEFIPERFTEENKNSRPSCTHMPFGEGPRTCVGLRFALMQTKLGLIHILKDYSVHLPSCTPTELEFTARSFLFQPKEHLKLVFRKLDAVKN